MESVGRIQEISADIVGYTRKDVLGIRRTTTVSRARQLAMLAARERGGFSYEEIGRSFKRDHTTAMIAIKRARALIVTDHHWQEHYDALIKRLEAGV